MGRGDEYGMAASDKDEAKAETEVIEDYIRPLHAAVKSKPDAATTITAATTSNQPTPATSNIRQHPQQ